MRIRRDFHDRHSRQQVLPGGQARQRYKLRRTGFRCENVPRPGSPMGVVEQRFQSAALEWTKFHSCPRHHPRAPVLRLASISYDPAGSRGASRSSRLRRSLVQTLTRHTMRQVRRD